MKILYLYSELVGYQIPVFKEYTNRYNATVYVVSWDKKKLKPYIPPKLKNVTYYKRSEYTKNQLLKLVRDIGPDIVYISGWMDKEYLIVARKLREIKIPVVTGFDDQWHGNLRQLVASIIFPFFRKYFFSHAWVAGPYQYEYAKRLKFKNNEIIFNLLSCDIKLFSKGLENIESKRNDYPKSFLYVGNFRYVKGTDILIEAFKIYQKKYKGDWKLICVGNGDMCSLLKGQINVEVLSFSSQEELLDITKRAGVFVLPSRSEQWGVVVQEFAAAAIPIIISEIVGAKPEFFIEKFNGLSYCNNLPEDLAKAMYLMSIKDNNELIRMCKNSFDLSHKITPKISAASFLSILN